MSRRHRVRRARPDRGFTLVEMLIALVLSGVIAGVTVAAMLTSMAVIESTTDEVADSTDAGLISAYFYRDAQAAGITDPATALPNATLGISVDARASIDPWAGCPQAGSFVARFAWLAAPTAAGSRLVAATYALSSAGVLVRRSCDNGTTVDVELARHLTSTVVSCTPASCLTPDTVSLSITGSAVHNATDLTLVASVRSEGEEVPVVATAGQAPLLVLGTSQGAPCPDLLLAGTGAVRVIGDVVVSDSCGATPIGGIMTKLGSAPIEMRTGVVDPLRAVIEPAHACAVTGADPTPVGSSPSATSVVVYGQPVRVTGTITFAPGRYVFCKGLTVAAGATVTGTEVFLDVVGGSVSVESTATVNLAAQSTGPFANVLLWVSSSESVGIVAAGRPSAYSGSVHAAGSVVSIMATSPLQIGGLVAAHASIAGAAALRLGLPIPNITVASNPWSTGEVGAHYPLTALDAAGGTAPYTWSAVGVPAGLTLDATGSITGTPTAAGSFAVTATAVDATLAAGVRDFAATILPAVTIGRATAAPAGQVGVTYPPSPWTAANGRAPYAFSAANLPPGMTIDASGSLVGTPTQPGSFAAVATVVDALGGTASRADTIVIRPRLGIGAPIALADAKTGVVYAAVTAVGVGGLPPYQWAASGLPAGISMTSTGTLTGTPTMVGSFGVTITVADAAGASASAAMRLTVTASATTLRPLAAAQGFQLFVLGAAQIVSTSTPGAVAVGGNLTLGGVQVVANGEVSTFTAAGAALPDGLLVGGSIDLAASTGTSYLNVAGGWLHLGNLGADALLTVAAKPHVVLTGVSDTSSTPRVVVAAAQPVQAIVAPGAFPFASAFVSASDASAAMSGLTPTACANVAFPTLVAVGGGYSLSLVPGTLNIWNVTIAQLTSMGPIDGNVHPDSATPLVINVTDVGVLRFPARSDPLITGGIRSAILWNFPFATSLTIDSNVAGTLDAPGADVTATGIQFEGDIIAKTLHLIGSVGWLAHFTGTVDCGLPLALLPGGLAGGQVGTILPAASLTATGGIAPYRWTATGVPAGLTLGVTGQLTGSPTTAGAFTIQATVTDATGAVAVGSYPIVVSAQLTIAGPGSLPTAAVGTISTATFAASGGTAPITWTATGVPTGLTMAATGVLSGTPTIAGAFVVVVTATDARMATSTVSRPLTIATAAGCTVPSSGWLGEYFGNITLSGTAALCRADASINFTWGAGSPGSPVPTNNFSVRWTRTVDFAAGTYDFTTGSDDGRRMYIDGVLVLNDWNTQLYPGSIKVTPAALSAGLHTIVLEYFDGTGDAAASLDWALTAPVTCPTKVKDWTGEYYSGIGLTGTRLLCQDDVLVNFNWGLGSPDPRLPVDGFSVRWTNNATFAAAGSYVFQMGSDDGARLYVDGALVIDVWTNRTYAVSTATVVLSKGKHVIVMEYYENAGPARATLTW